MTGATWLWDEESFSVINPDVLTPSQWADARTSESDNWVHKLMFAALKDALMQYRNTHRESVRREIRGWIASYDTSSPFSFETICDELKLPKERIREAVREDSMRPIPKRMDLRRPFAALTA